MAYVSEFEGGLIRKSRAYHDPNRALEAVGLSPRTDSCTAYAAHFYSARGAPVKRSNRSAHSALPLMDDFAGTESGGSSGDDFATLPRSY
jgi:hypothetical protein